MLIDGIVAKATMCFMMGRYSFINSFNSGVVAKATMCFVGARHLAITEIKLFIFSF